MLDEWISEKNWLSTEIDVLMRCVYFEYSTQWMHEILFGFGFFPISIMVESFFRIPLRMGFWYFAVLYPCLFVKVVVRISTGIRLNGKQVRLCDCTWAGHQRLWSDILRVIDIAYCPTLLSSSLDGKVPSSETLSNNKHNDSIRNFSSIV